MKNDEYVLDKWQQERRNYSYNTMFGRYFEKQKLQEGAKMKRMGKLAVVLGVLFILYFLTIKIVAVHGTNFYFIWLIMGVALIGWAICMKKEILIPHIPVWIRRGFLILFVMGCALFVVVEGMIMSGFGAAGKDNLDYIIVLGAQMKAHGPSRVLKMRLDKACDYLAENPDTIVIVSGAQGNDEHVSEAQGMYDYLVEQGISPEHIIKEDQSRNTNQNINYSSAFLDKEKDSVGIVTNNFHIFRATHIAKKSGYADVCGIAAPSEFLMQANNMLREFMGVMKDFLVGNI